PIGVLLISSALQTIPQSIYEAAEVDGASKIKQFFQITFPLISPMLGFTSFVIFVLNFNAFDIIWMITQGGPGGTTETLPILVYRTAFKSFRLGESSAIAVIIALILGIIGLLFFKFTSRNEEK
ncbi:MAG: sugar ABC transporter permease, partial [Clostridiales bacterium]|nr:sugar ABC transporter permease [Clostridiales bacterium]